MADDDQDGYEPDTKLRGSNCNIEGNARAFKMASALSQDEALARNFEGDMSLEKSTPK